jgi:hypothetical protein
MFSRLLSVQSVLLQDIKTRDIEVFGFAVVLWPVPIQGAESPLPSNSFDFPPSKVQLLTCSYRCSDLYDVMCDNYKQMTVERRVVLTCRHAPWTMTVTTTDACVPTA